jgi:hypothetical protein
MIVGVDVKPGSFEAARTFLTVFSGLFARRGWMVSLHGSTIERMRGRDIDFIFNRYAAGEEAASEDEIIATLRRLGFQVRIDEHRGDWRGLVGIFRGYALDITLIGGNT